MHMLEKALDPATDIRMPQYNVMFKTGVHIARILLGSIYYEKAVQDTLGGRDPTEWVNKLRDLATHDMMSEPPQVEFEYCISAPLFNYGRYLRKYKKAEPEEWMKWFRGSMLLALDMLSDDDPINDLDAYKRFIVTLIAAGDYRNAQAAAAVCFMPLSMTDSNWITAARKLHFVKRVFGCDGLCSASGTTYNLDYKEMYFCVECIDLKFCEVCHLKLINSELPVRECDPKHEFLQLYPVLDEAKGIAARFDGEKMIVQQEWLDELRKTWS
jgi:hypothetical protein